MKKRFLSIIIMTCVVITSLVGCGNDDTSSADSSNQIVVYNWGEYIDPEVLDMFEEETGIEVIYEEFETNEVMYPKVVSGAVKYDVICPSDYMIERMISEGLLAELNYDNIENIKNIDEDQLKASESFDPGNKYAVPYCYGTVGILYNTTMVDEPIDSWEAIFDEKYADDILMTNSVRDAFGIALKYLGYSINSTDEDELQEAEDLLYNQYDLVQAYVVDEVRDLMIGESAALGVIYSGEAIYTQRENSNLEYVVPKEGSNVWIDSWVIPANCNNKEGAEAFINFLCRPDIALLNFEYITYSTPNKAARDMIEDEDIKNSDVAFPDSETVSRCETFSFLGDEWETYYNELFKLVKSR